MWFYKKPAGRTSAPLDQVNTIIGVIFIVAMIVLAIVANFTGWATGADKILTIISGLGVGIPVGKFWGERSAVS